MSTEYAADTGRILVRVSKVVAEAVDIRSYELRPDSGTKLPEFSPGSHIDVFLPNGLVRQYSLCNPAMEMHRYVIAVLRERESRGGSSAMHEQVKEGDSLEISHPRNCFPLAPNAHRSVLLAGGIGITPMLCMAQSLSTAGRQFELHYFARSRARAAFLDPISSSGYSSNCRFHFDDEATDQTYSIASLLAVPADGAHLYVCGPTGFMEAVLGTAGKMGWSDQQVHFEYFGAPSRSNDSGVAFEVQLASSGRVIAVPAGKTVTQALHDAGVDILTSCEQGVCGSCLTGVLNGIPDHRDLYLSEDERGRNNQFLPCCSRSLSPRLVLDL